MNTSIQSICKVDKFGNKRWYINGKYHRIDGPAIELADGTKIWYINGKEHREDGPAIEHPYGYKAWFHNGKQHRKDGPAIERTNRNNEWWCNGVYYNALDEFCNAANITGAEKTFVSLKWPNSHE